LALAALCVTALPFSAQAALQGGAGNTIIRNHVSVAYSDAKGVAQTPVTADVQITVNTVPATPTVLSFNPSPGSTDGTGATQAYAVIIRNNSNGPATISLAASDGSFNNVGAGAAPALPANITLGSTIIDPSDGNSGAKTIANTGTISFAVPNDGLSGAGVINGIANGDMVYLYSGSTYYGPFTAGSISDPAPGAITVNPATPGQITLTNNTGASIGPFTPAAGWEILSAKQVTVTVTQGTITDPTSAALWVTTVSATMAGAAAGTGTVTTNAHGGRLAVQKYVRNVTSGVVGGTSLAAPAGLPAATYYQTGVNGKPGDTMEYMLVITGAGTGASSVVTATDPVPTYTTLVSSSGAYGANNSGGATGTFAEALRSGVLQSFTIPGSGIGTVGYGKSAGTAYGSTMTFYLGNGSTSAAGGTINAGETDYVIYQVTIN
jgi:uncharacterized repeat protein (TIGR01451 family)